jgi:hypothetical protein
MRSGTLRRAPSMRSKLKDCAVHAHAAGAGRTTDDLAPVPSVGSLREAAAAAQATTQQQVLGIVEPGEALPVPHGWRSSGALARSCLLTPGAFHNCLLSPTMHGAA